MIQICNFPFKHFELHLAEIVQSWHDKFINKHYRWVRRKLDIFLIRPEENQEVFLLIVCSLLDFSDLGK